MKLSDLKDRVFRMTNHTYQDQFHMRDLINDAINTLAGDAKLQSSTAINLVAGTGSYALPTTYKSPIALVDGTLDNPLMILNLLAPDSFEHGYTIYNGQLVMKPTPTGAKTLNFYFYAYPAELTNDTDLLTIDYRYGDAIAAYASAMILSLPGSEVSSGLVDRYFAMWEEARNKFKVDMQQKVKQATVRKTVIW